MKRKFLFVAICMFFIQVLNITVYGAEVGSISISTPTAKPGDSNVEVNISLDENPGICGMILKISYDQRLTLVNVEQGNALNTLTLAEFAVPYINPINASWDGISSDTSKGTILKLFFDVADNAEAGNYNISVSYENGDVYDNDLNDLSLKITNGYITVKSANIHTHTMKKVLGKVADCITKGNIEYWECTGCHKSYSDESGLNEIFDVVLSLDQTNHIGNTEVRHYREPTETQDGYTGDVYCIACNKKIKTGQAISASGGEVDEPSQNQNDEKIERKDTSRDEWINPFKDIKKTDSYYNAVQFVYENGLFKGVSATEFAPEITMTRAMFVTVLGRLAGVDTMYFYGSSYDDVILGEWYAPYVEWASEYGIVQGYGDGRFGVNDKITIEQAAVIMARYAEYVGLNTTSSVTLIHYQDAGYISSWAIDQMRWAVENGLYFGENHYLNPQSPANRSLVAEILYSFVSKFDE